MSAIHHSTLFTIPEEMKTNDVSYLQQFKKTLTGWLLNGSFDTPDELLKRKYYNRYVQTDMV